MTLFIVIILLTLAIGCAEEDDKFSCGAQPSGLSSLSIGDSVATVELQPTFQSIEPQVYQSGGFCSEGYDFQQYNKDSGGWCYYIQVDVDCDSQLVTSIYNGA